MNSYVDGSGLRISVWLWRLPDNSTGPNRCVACAPIGTTNPAHAKAATAATTQVTLIGTPSLAGLDATRPSLLRSDGLASSRKCGLQRPQAWHPRPSLLACYFTE